MIMQVAIFKADYVGLPNYRNGDCWFCFRFHFYISHRQEEHPSDEMCCHFTLCMWQSLNCSSGIRRDADSSLSSPAPSSCPCLTQGTRGIDFVPLGLTSHLDATSTQLSSVGVASYRDLDAGTSITALSG